MRHSRYTTETSYDYKQNATFHKARKKSEFEVK